MTKNTNKVPEEVFEGETVITVTDDDPEPETNTEDWYAWAKRQYEKEHRLALAAPRESSSKRPSSGVCRTNPALRTSFDMASQGPDKDDVRDDLYCERPCGRKSKRSKKHRCPTCKHKTLGNDLLCQKCSRSNNRCPCCGLYHDRVRPKRDQAEVDPSEHYLDSWQTDIDKK